MNIFPINLYQNDKVQFQANPKTILTVDMVKTMPAEDILDLSTATLKNQDINIVRMIRSKIDNFVRILTSKCNYIKANKIDFTTKEIDATKASKKKAKKLEQTLSKKIREEKFKKGAELNPDTEEFIPIEYIILPGEEKIHQKLIKMDDLITDKMDADKYKYQIAKHDRNISRKSSLHISKMLKEQKSIEAEQSLSVYDIDKDYIGKKVYNDYAEKIVFAETKIELAKLQEKIGMTKLEVWFKNDLLELINRKINLLNNH